MRVPQDPLGKGVQWNRHEQARALTLVSWAESLVFPVETPERDSAFGLELVEPASLTVAVWFVTLGTKHSCVAGTVSSWILEVAVGLSGDY